MSKSIQIHKMQAEQALEARAKLITEHRSVMADRNLTQDERRERAQKLEAEIEFQMAAATAAVEAGEREAEARSAFAKAGNLVMPEGGAGKPAVRMNVPMRPGQSFRDIAGGATPEQFGDYVRGLVYGDETRAQSEGVNSQGGALVPTNLSSTVLDLARNLSATAAAGAAVVPLSTKTTQYPVLTADAIASWRNEAAPISESAAAFAPVTFNAQNLTVIVKASWELIDDAEGDLGTVLVNSFAKSFAVALDQAALYGTGVSPNPLGLTKVAGVAKTALGANGLALTSYDPIVSACAAVRGANYEPTAYVMAERTAAALAVLKETGTGAYLNPPAYLDGIKQVRSGNIPTNLTQGTSSLASDIIVGDFSMLGIGMRENFNIRILRERFADTGQVAFIGQLRADVQPFRTNAFSIINGVL